MCGKSNTNILYNLLYRKYRYVHYTYIMFMFTTRAPQEIGSDRQSDSCSHGLNVESSSLPGDREKTNYTVYYYVFYIIVNDDTLEGACIDMRAENASHGEGHNGH